MEVRDLACVVAVAEELHFGRAALRLQMSQAPLTARIQRIERELGHRLFDRTTRTVRLTPVGEELHRRAVSLLGQLEDMVADLDLVAAGRAGRLRVGFVSSASYSVLPDAVRRVRETAPGLQLDLVPLTSPAQAERLHEGTLDLGVVRGDRAHFDLPTEPLLEEDLVAVVPAGHLFAVRREVAPADLAEEPMVFFSVAEMPGFVAEVRGVFADASLPRVRHRVVHVETALGLVAAGEGFTVLPASVSRTAPAAVRSIPIVPTRRTALHLAHPPAGPMPAARLLAEALRTVATGGGAT